MPICLKDAGYFWGTNVLPFEFEIFDTWKGASPAVLHQLVCQPCHPVLCHHCLASPDRGAWPTSLASPDTVLLGGSLYALWFWSGLESPNSTPSLLPGPWPLRRSLACSHIVSLQARPTVFHRQFDLFSSVLVDPHCRLQCHHGNARTSVIGPIRHCQSIQHA
jgi:hypothetical protein